MRTRTILLVAASSVLVTAAAPRTNAETLAENTHVIGGGGYSHYSKGNTFAAENFTLDSPATVTAISHVAISQPTSPHPVSINWAIYSETHGLPGKRLAAATEAAYTTSPEGNFSVFRLTRYRISTGPIHLEPGKYWVAFDNNAPSGPPDWHETTPAWYLASQGTLFDGISAFSTDGGRAWGAAYPGRGFNFTFRVEGELRIRSQPEPSAAAPAASRVVSPRTKSTTSVRTPVRRRCVRAVRRKACRFAVVR